MGPGSRSEPGGLPLLSKLSAADLDGKKACALAAPHHLAMALQLQPEIACPCAPAVVSLCRDMLAVGVLCRHQSGVTSATIITTQIALRDGRAGPARSPEEVTDAEAAVHQLMPWCMWHHHAIRWGLHSDHAVSRQALPLYNMCASAVISSWSPAHAGSHLPAAQPQSSAPARAASRSAAACRTFAQVALNQLLQLSGSVCGCRTSPLQGLARFFDHNPDMLRLRAGLEPYLTSNDPEVLLSPAGIFATVRPHPASRSGWWSG